MNKEVNGKLIPCEIDERCLSFEVIRNFAEMVSDYQPMISEQVRYGINTIATFVPSYAHKYCDLVLFKWVDGNDYFVIECNEIDTLKELAKQFSEWFESMDDGFGTPYRAIVKIIDDGIERSAQISLYEVQK